MHDVPMVRLTLERMEHTLIAALSAHELEIDQDIQRAVKAYCTPENIGAIVQRQVQLTLDLVVREEVDQFYRYGKGREVVRRTIEDLLEAGRSEP